MRITQVVDNFDKHGFHMSENAHMQLQNQSPNIMLSCGNKLLQSLAIIINLCDPMGRLLLIKTFFFAVCNFHYVQEEEQMGYAIHR